MSISSVTTQDMQAMLGDPAAEFKKSNSATPQISSMPSLTAANPTSTAASSTSSESVHGLPMFTPPQTPGSVLVSAGVSAPASSTKMSHPQGSPAVAGTKREADQVDDVHAQEKRDKRRRIQPTLLSGESPPDTSNSGTSNNTDNATSTI